MPRKARASDSWTLALSGISPASFSRMATASRRRASGPSERTTARVRRSSGVSAGSAVSPASRSASCHEARSPGLPARFRASRLRTQSQGRVGLGGAAEQGFKARSGRPSSTSVVVDRRLERWGSRRGRAPEPLSRSRPIGLGSEGWPPGSRAAPEELRGRSGLTRGASSARSSPRAPARSPRETLEHQELDPRGRGFGLAIDELAERPLGLVGLAQRARGPGPAGPWRRARRGRRRPIVGPAPRPSRASPGGAPGPRPSARPRAGTRRPWSGAIPGCRAAPAWPGARPSA